MNSLYTASGLLALVLVTGAAPGHAAARGPDGAAPGDPDEAAAKAAVQKLGGHAHGPAKGPGKFVTQVTFSGKGAQLDDAGLAELVPHLAKFKHLKCLNLSGTQVTG